MACRKTVSRLGHVVKLSSDMSWTASWPGCHVCRKAMSWDGYVWNLWLAPIWQIIICIECAVLLTTCFYGISILLLDVLIGIMFCFYSLFNQPSWHQGEHIIDSIFKSIIMILLFCIFKSLLDTDMTSIILASMCVKNCIYLLPYCPLCKTKTHNTYSSAHTMRSPFKIMVINIKSSSFITSPPGHVVKLRPN